MNRKLVTIIFLIALISFLISSIKAYSQYVSEDLSDSVLRLHVIANSDTSFDQELKYVVRDSLINYMNELLSKYNSKEDILYYSQNHIQDLKKIAKQAIINNGYNYDVTVELGNFPFPTKTYSNISFPAGYYDALKVKIGKGKGQNWWCVMFPPLCFVDVSSAYLSEDNENLLEENLSEEDSSLILKENVSSKMKFKIVELFNEFSTKIAQN